MSSEDEQAEDMLLCCPLSGGFSRHTLKNQLTATTAAAAAIAPLFEF